MFYINFTSNPLCDFCVAIQYFTIIPTHKYETHLTHQIVVVFLLATEKSAFLFAEYIILQAATIINVFTVAVTVISY